MIRRTSAVPNICSLREREHDGEHGRQDQQMFDLELKAKVADPVFQNLVAAVAVRLAIDFVDVDRWSTESRAALRRFSSATGSGGSSSYSSSSESLSGAV